MLGLLRVCPQSSTDDSCPKLLTPCRLPNDFLIPSISLSPQVSEFSVVQKQVTDAPIQPRVEVCTDLGEWGVRSRRFTGRMQGWLLVW